MALAQLKYRDLFQQSWPSIVGRRGSLVLAGVNHRSLTIDAREKLAIRPEHYREVLKLALACSGVEEAVVVSTCNRVELIAAVNDPEPDADPDDRGDEREVEGGVSPSIYQGFTEQFESLLQRFSGHPPDSFREGIYALNNQQAVGHLFRVASGLDSLVPGEAQILGQLKVAYAEANACGATKTLLNKLFQRAFGVAKSVRSRTEIGRMPVSICFAARKLAEQVFGDLSQSSVLIIGAGETGGLMLKHLAAANVREIYVANKSWERAVQLCRPSGAIPVTLDRVSSILSQVDIVVGAVTLESAGDFLVTEELARTALRKRKSYTQLYLDLGVPRNIDPILGEIPNLFLYNIDDLQSVVQRNLDLRSTEAARAEEIIGAEVDKFSLWMSRRAFEPAIKELRDSILQLRSSEVARALKQLQRSRGDAGSGHADSGIADNGLARGVLERLVDSVLTKVLHNPVSVLRERGVHDEELVERFFELFLKKP